jgi:hypothetical protein
MGSRRFVVVAGFFIAAFRYESRRALLFDTV